MSCVEYTVFGVFHSYSWILFWRVAYMIGLVGKNEHVRIAWPFDDIFPVWVMR